jgi:UDP-N-acetylmuramate dehydrogenase
MNFNLSEVTWFRVGGAAEVLFKPADAEDLAHFLKHKPIDIPHIVIGVGSNLLVRDGGVKGVVIKLGREFAQLTTHNLQLVVGSGALDINVAELAAQNNVGGLEFLSGIPGTIGGALFMNAGAYGREIKDVLVWAEGVDVDGNIHRLTNAECGFSYRHSSVPEGFVFTKCCLQGEVKSESEIRARIKEISAAREASQPVRARTGGSTFANPEGKKAWQLIDEAGCRGLTIGGAQMSEMHCNFMINTGNATAKDLEDLGETVRAKVKIKTGVDLRWEIQRIGHSPLAGESNSEAIRWGE